MNRGIYPILSGALAQERQVQIFANNVANVNTVGFKQDAPLFRSILARSVAMPPLPGISDLRPAGAAERVFVAVPGLQTGFEPGRLRVTGNPLDLAIQGNGFFEIKTPQGVRYTRNGIFHLDGRRRLVTELGYPVMGQNGELTLPPGDVRINPRGMIEVNGQRAGVIKVVEFPADERLEKVEDGLFAGRNPKPVKEVMIQPGSLEESNVNAVGEMVKMIQSMRMYESAQKLIQTFDRMTELAVQDVGRVA